MAPKDSAQPGAVRAKKSKGGRPKGAKNVKRRMLSVDDLDEIYRKAAIGLSNSLLSMGLGIAPNQFQAFLRDNPKVADAIYRGRFACGEKIMAKIFKSAELGCKKSQLLVLRFVGGYNDIELERDANASGSGDDSSNDTGRIRELLVRYRDNQPPPSGTSAESKVSA